MTSPLVTYWCFTAYRIVCVCMSFTLSARLLCQVRSVSISPITFQCLDAAMRFEWRIKENVQGTGDRHKLSKNCNRAHKTGHDLVHDTHHTRRATKFSVNRKISATKKEGHTRGTDKQTNFHRVVKPPPSRQTRRARVPIRRATSVGCPFCKRVSAR